MVDIDAFVQSMKNWSDKFVLTDEGDINNFFGIVITHIDDNKFKVSQPFLIDSIISLLKIGTNNYGMYNNTKSTPVGNPLSHKDVSGKTRKEAWN